MPRRSEKIYPLFFNRMTDLGYSDITEFYADTKVDLSFETIRRAIHESRMNIRHDFVVRLMQALQFSPEEIATELKKRGDKHIWRLVAESREKLVLTGREQKIIEGLRNKDQAIYSVVSSLVQHWPERTEKECAAAT